MSIQFETLNGLIFGECFRTSIGYSKSKYQMVWFLNPESQERITGSGTDFVRIERP